MSDLTMPVQFAAILIFVLAAIAFVVIPLVLQRFITPKNPYPEKLGGYECGEQPIGSPWIRFNIRYYIIAILFLIFDVEVIFIIPWAVVYRELLARPDVGMLVFFEMFVFLLVLGVGLIYCWAKGHLEWVLPDKKPKERTHPPLVESSSK